MIRKNIFYLFVVGLFLLVSGQQLFAKTMFMDGLYYATIARNLAVQKGDIWHLFFSETVFHEFHEHPPLAMWLQSWYFKLFGTSWWVDKIYSVSTYIFIGMGIRLCWKNICQNMETVWCVMLLWLFVPAVFWAVGNNLLENTLTIFTTFSIAFNLMSIQKQKVIFIFLAGLFLFFAFLTKGFVALFPLLFFFFYWCIFKSISFLRMLQLSALYFIGFLVPLILLLIFNSEALEFFQKYFSIQVLNSLKNVVTVNSRFFIIKRLASELIVPFVLLTIVSITLYKYRRVLKPSSEQKKWAYLFLCLGMTAVLPIMISMKQSGFYILASYPLFAIAFALFFQPYLKKINELLVSKKGFRMSAIILFIAGMVYSLNSWNHYGKDAEKVKDIELILNTITPGQTINISMEMNEDWALFAYFYRFGFVSLKATDQPSLAYLLINPLESNRFVAPGNYRLIPLKTKLFHLYHRIN
jgi:4-amino-4-deoxy-L-arabinose transferase-like glycosyltransferase